MLWAVLVISVAGNLAMVPSSVYTPVFRAVLPGEPHPLPVVIPRSRITSEPEQFIPDDAAVFCDLGLKTASRTAFRAGSTNFAQNAPTTESARQRCFLTNNGPIYP